MTTSGGLGESETAGLTMNIVPKQGGNQLSGLVFVSGFSKGMQADNFTDELKARGATQPNPFTVNVIAPGDLYGDRIRQLDVAAKKVIRIGGQRITFGVDLYNLLNNNVTLGFGQTFVPSTAGWQSPTSYMNPRVVRLNAEYAW